MAPSPSPGNVCLLPERGWSHSELIPRCVQEERGNARHAGVLSCGRRSPSYPHRNDCHVTSRLNAARVGTLSLPQVYPKVPTSPSQSNFSQTKSEGEKRERERERRLSISVTQLDCHPAYNSTQTFPNSTKIAPTELPKTKMKPRWPGLRMSTPTLGLCSEDRSCVPFF